MTDHAIQMKNPAHPGEFVRELLEESGLSRADPAVALGVTRPALSDLVDARAALSPDMALRVEKAFGVSRETLMRMQDNFAVARADRQL
jgi:addiction module HigA family antidote